MFASGRPIVLDSSLYDLVWSASPGVFEQVLIRTVSHICSQDAVGALHIRGETQMVEGLEGSMLVIDHGLPTADSLFDDTILERLNTLLAPQGAHASVMPNGSIGVWSPKVCSSKTRTSQSGSKGHALVLANDVTTKKLVCKSLATLGISTTTVSDHESAVRTLGYDPSIDVVFSALPLVPAHMPKFVDLLFDKSPYIDLIVLDDLAASNQFESLSEFIQIQRPISSRAILRAAETVFDL